MAFLLDSGRREFRWTKPTKKPIPTAQPPISFRRTALSSTATLGCAGPVTLLPSDCMPSGDATTQPRVAVLPVCFAQEWQAVYFSPTQTMGPFERIIWIVLDSVGIGALPDAADSDDVGRNTLGHIAK